MRRRGYSLVMIVASFGAALFLGRVLFEPVAVPAVPNRALSVAPVVAEPRTGTGEKPVIHEYTAPAPGLSSALTVVKDGVKGNERRMPTLFFEEYAKGILYSFPARRPVQARWLPKAMEYRNKFEVVHSVPLNPGSVGRVTRVEGQDRFEYQGTYPQVDECQKVNADGSIEHDYLLLSKPGNLDRADLLAFTGRLELSPGLTLWQGQQQIKGRHLTTKGLEIKDARGQVVYTIRRPLVWDHKVSAADGTLSDELQSRHPGNVTGAQYQVEMGEGFLDLAVAVSSRWLAAPERTYPVVVDPNIGPQGLTDAPFFNGSPVYTGAEGQACLLQINNGAVRPDQFNALDYSPGVSYKLNDVIGAGCNVALPFPADFTWIFYPGVCPNPKVAYRVHIDGYVNFIPPDQFGPCTRENTPLPDFSTPNDAVYGYWDQLQFSGTDASGIYVSLIGNRIGNRQLVFYWNDMAYEGGDGNERISFNVILHECNKTVEIRILKGQVDFNPNPSPGTVTNPSTAVEQDRGEATVGIEACGGVAGIQYDYNSNTAGPPTPSGESTPLPPLAPCTQVTFNLALQANLQVVVDGNSVAAGTAYDPGSCLPVKSCFEVVVTPPNRDCGVITSGFPDTYGFRWEFSRPDPILGGNVVFATYSTRKFCRTFVEPGAMEVNLTVIDGQQTQSTFGPFTYLVCDVPRNSLKAEPQGGLVPLTVNFHFVTSASFTETIAQQAPDDFNIVCVGTIGLLPTDPVVDAGVDGMLHTKPEGDDVLDLVNDQILAGLNGIAETTALNGSAVVVAGADSNGDGIPECVVTAPGGDDLLVGINIVAGANGLSDSTAVAPDRQVIPQGSVAGASASPVWIIELLQERNLQDPPAFFANLPAGSSNPVFTFPRRGIYKVSAIVAGIDVVTNLPTSRKDSIFIFVEDPERPNNDNLLIEGSEFAIQWDGKTDGPDQNLDPDNPFKDTFLVRGMLNLPNIAASALSGSVNLRARVVLNGTKALFDVADGQLNPVGKVMVTDAFTGTQRSFSLSLPSGRFSVWVKNARLDDVLGVYDRTETKLMPAHIGIELWDFTDPNNPVSVYPQEPETRGAMITYEYSSRVAGSAVGHYAFGQSTSDGLFVIGKPGQPGSTTNPPTPPEIFVVNVGGDTIMVSGVFLVTQANLRLTGANVRCDIRGRFARFGGDFLRPQANSDVTVQIGPARDSLGNTIASGYKETLNVSTSPTWSVQSRSRGRVFAFKRSPSLGRTGILSLQMADSVGDFRVLTSDIPNRDEGVTGGVGLDATQITQVVPFNLFITHEGDQDATLSLQNFDGQTEFLVTKSGKTSFRRK